ncbi:MAG: S9 family peptidase [Gammaproteobacteria bacterium]
MRIALVLGLAAAFLCNSVETFAAAPLPAEAFGTIPQVTEVDLSPSGNLIAWCHTPPTGSAVVVIFDVGTQKYRRSIPLEPGLNLRSITWADDETLLLTVSTFATYGRSEASDHFEVFRTFAADVAGGKSRMLLMTDGERGFVTGASLLAARTGKPKTVIMSTYDFSAAAARGATDSRLAGGRGDSGWTYSLFEVDIRTGAGRRIEQGNPFTSEWVVDNNGAAVARADWNPKTERFSVLAKEGGGWREILHEEHNGTRDLHGLTADGKAIMISAANDQGMERLEALPLDGSPRTVLFEESGNSIAYVIHDRFTRAPVGVMLGGQDGAVHWLDPDSERRARSVTASFPGKKVSVYSRAENNQRVIAEVESPSSPPVYYLVDFAAKKADVVGEAYPELADAKLGEVRMLTYKARDGAEVPAYLTLPPGSAGKNLPLILFPHGGPEARDDYVFDWFAQFLAARGYAVLQPQFRGSTGFGEAWRKAGYRQWGLLMQDDLTDGVKALVDQGVADPKRVCIVGMSYGGYAALAGAAFTPDLFRCAESVNGVSDLPAMLSYENARGGEESDSIAYWRSHIGPGTDRAVIERSPARAATQVKVPVLLLHSTKDTVVPSIQSEIMAHALSVLDKPATFVRLSGDDHWLSQTATRLQVLKETEKFLQANLQ